MTTATFKDFNLHPSIQQTLETLGFVTPTEIQAKAYPILLLPEKTDIHAQAQTGTGKTLAFGLPLLHRINAANRYPQALIVAPTRELALQICESLKPFAKALGLTIETIYGGSSMELQIRSLRRGVHIVVGTPGRLNDHLRRKTLDLSKVGTLVLDEADIMLDMGFKDEVDEILTHMPENREIWLFSATVKQGISDIMQSHMSNPQSVRVSKKAVMTSTTKHYYCVASHKQRLTALCRFIEAAPDFYGFIFCQTKILTSEIAEQLLLRGYKVGALHGDLSQVQRNMVIKKFKAKEITIVVATDVAARGIDIAHLTHVMNFSLPEDQESYVHRAGRTGRAGRDGIAITFINKGEIRIVQGMQRKFTLVMDPINVPTREELLTARLQEIQQYCARISEEHTMPTPALDAFVSALSGEEQGNLLKKVLYDKFLKVIEQEQEFSATPQLGEGRSEGRREGRFDDSGMQELFIQVGADDGVTAQDVLSVLEKANIPAEALQKIRVIKRRTFLTPNPDMINAVRDALTNVLIGNRRVRAALVEQQEERREGGRGGFNRGGSRGGYDRGGGERRSGGDRGDRGGFRRRY